MKSGGVDFNAANALGIKTVIAPGLPGKYTPVTAGEIMYSCIRQELAERGYYL